MTLLYYDPIYLEHDTGGHPEKADRLRSIVKHLAATGLDTRCQQPAFGPVSAERLERVHDPEYAAQIRHFAEKNGGYIEADTVVSRRSYDAACMAAGAVCDAVQRVVAGEDRRAALPGTSARASCLGGSRYGLLPL